MRRALFAIAFALNPMEARAQASISSAPMLSTGTIAGTVRDESGRAIVDAIVTVDRSARQVRTDSAGEFALERVPTGLQEILVRRIGYRAARAMLRVRADSVIAVEVTLVSTAQSLNAVRVEEQLLNQLGGVVLDSAGLPVADADVDVVGLRRMMRSDAEGRVLFVDLPEGNYLVEVRKEGYRLARRGVQMVARIERDLAIRLYAGEDPRTSAALARVVAQEADRRQSLAGNGAVFVSRSELERHRETPLLTALEGSSGAMALEDVKRQPRDIRLARLNKSLDPRGTTAGKFGMDGGHGSAIGCVLVNGHEVASGGLLMFFRASEVELVEIFPRGSEHSRTFCGRFPPSTGCQCPPDPAGLVVWLKR